MTGGKLAGGRTFLKRGLAGVAPEVPPRRGQTPLRVTTNSNGYPIINADGKEYATCG